MNPPAITTTLPPAQVQQAWKTAKSFEAMALNEFLKPMFDTVDTSSGPFGGGEAEGAMEAVDGGRAGQASHRGGGHRPGEVGVHADDPYAGSRTNHEMNEDALTKATIRLVEILEAENAELRALDFKAAGRLLGAKQAATAELTAAQAAALHTQVGLQDLAGRLNALAEENRVLLERAITVQSRVLSTVARAAQAAAPEPHYGPSGKHPVRTMPAMAIRANA